MENNVKINGYCNFINKIKTKNGKDLMSFNLSVYAGKVNEKNTYANIKVVCFFLNNDIKNKDFILVEGKLKGSVYETNEGITKKEVIIVADNVSLSNNKSKKEETAEVFNIDDNIPF